MLGGTQTIYGQTTQVYSVGYTYDLSGHVTLMSYPSGHVVNYNYDNAGRLADKDSNNLAFTGTLGDNTLRTYSRGISYAPGGQMTQERLGTTTAIYNKLFYNSRGQLAEIREGLSANNDSSERGAIINFYSDHCWGMCTPTQQNDGSMPDNNGNLLKQEIDVPGSDHFSVQWFVYDSLNRLKSANEVDYYSGSQQERWRQTYIYDRFGNRTIDQNSANTFGDGIPKPNFSVVTASNRLGVPNGYSGTMSYDAAGNLDIDTYSGGGTRTYDAENRMTGAQEQNSTYAYDGDGRRVKRKAGNTETWQVYGIGGELIAEYAANASYSSPQKEYGYRNGQLLVTATSPLPGGAPSFTNNPIQVGVTEVKAAHITELRNAINNLRSHLGMAGYSWITSATTNNYISASPILEMRTALDQALGVPSPTYAAGLAAGQPIKAIHIQELRDRLTAASGSDIRWLVTDQLGTPRMIFDHSGSLSAASRHDYLPFGEELFVGTGGRTSGMGYSIGDGSRQKFTSKERDTETGLDYFEARYLASGQGRFINVDSILIDGARLFDPQRINLYAYVRNNPLAYIDPTGRDLELANSTAQKQIRKNMDVALRADEIKNVQIKGTSVLLVDAKAIDVSNASPAYQALVQVIQAKTTTRYFGLEPGESVAQGEKNTHTFDQIREAGGATLFYDNGDRDVLVPVANNMTVEGESGGQIPNPEWRVWWHETAGHATLQSNAVAIENEIAVSIGQPRRSGGDHHDYGKPWEFKTTVRTTEEPLTTTTPILDEKALMKRKP